MIDYSSYNAATDDEVAGDMYRSLQIKPDSIKLNVKNRSALFKASRSDYWYRVTLDSCECGSFEGLHQRQAPCKHMFRLAHELGIALNFPEFDPARAAKYDPSSDIELLHTRWVEGDISFDCYKACKSALQKSVLTSKQLLKQMRKTKKKK